MAKVITKEEFLRLANLRQLVVEKIYDYQPVENESEVYIFDELFEDDCDSDVTTEEIDEDDEILEDIFCENDEIDYTWKEFVYDVIANGNGDIPSWKIANFITAFFGDEVSAGSVAAVKAAANR